MLCISTLQWIAISLIGAAVWQYMIEIGTVLNSNAQLPEDRRKSTNCLAHIDSFCLILNYLSNSAFMSFKNIKDVYFPNIFSFLVRSVLYLCLSVPAEQCALLLKQHRCSLPCDVVAFSIWIAVTVSTEPCLYEPTNVTAETTVMASVGRKSDSVYLWPWLCLYVSVALSLAFVFTRLHLRPAVRV